MKNTRLPITIAALMAASSTMNARASDLRPLGTDRPDTTESPYTVDSGHFQFETEIASWTRDGGGSEYALAEINAKFGLDATKDLQLVLPLYSQVRDGDEGFGDIQVRLKWNLWGNEEGDTALAIMPYVKLPTANGDLGNDEFEGGLIVPLAVNGSCGWTYGFQAQFDLATEENGNDHQFVLLNSATASHGITETTGFFVELVSILGTESASDWEAYFNTGLTWLVTPYKQFDGGVRAGLTDKSTDVMPFVGFSTKF